MTTNNNNQVVPTTNPVTSVLRIPLPVFNKKPTQTNGVNSVTLNVVLPSPNVNSIYSGAYPMINQTISTKDIELREWQVKWAEREFQILNSNYGVIDTSPMGSGKTYVTLYNAKRFGTPILVICPPIMINIWRNTANEYGVTVIDAISYQSLRSTKGHQPKHGLLHRYDTVTAGNVKQVAFAATERYLTLLKNGILIVCDEVQNIKNNSSQFKACNALVKPLIEMGGNSRFALLSATPFDKEEHATNLLRLIGFIRAHFLYVRDKKTKDFVLHGLQELINICNQIDKPSTDQLLLTYPPDNTRNIKLLPYQLYINVVKKSISGAMPKPINIKVENDVKNGFFNITGDYKEQLQNGVKDLVTAARFNPETGTVEFADQNIGGIITALRHIEEAKAYDIARVATKILAANGKNKVILSVRHKSTIRMITDILILFSPLVLNGEVTDIKKKQEMVRLFNEDPRYRVLLINTDMAVGISLHDTVGDYPRFMIIAPNYSMLSLIQTAGRIYRDGVKSKATVRFFYGRGDSSVEMGVLRALVAKAAVTRTTLEDINSIGTILPDSYPSEEEANV